MSVKQFRKIFQEFYQYQTVWETISEIISMSNSLVKYFNNSISVKQFGKIFQEFYQCQTVWENISGFLSVSNSLGKYFRNSISIKQFGKYLCQAVWKNISVILSVSNSLGLGPKLFDNDRNSETFFNVLVFNKTPQTAKNMQYCQARNKLMSAMISPANGNIEIVSISLITVRN